MLKTKSHPWFCSRQKKTWQPDKVILLMAEIRGSPVEANSLSLYLQGVFTSQAVVWDFFHQQYFFDIFPMKSSIVSINFEPYPSVILLA